MRDNFLRILSSLVLFQGSLAYAKIEALPDPKNYPVETAILTTAPHVPPALKRKKPARVIINLETKEVTGKLADGVDYTFWTFEGTVPGPMIRVRVGDYVEFTLKNHPTSKMPHNIDLHAVTGQGGGAEATLTVPGRSSKFSFRALNAGLYIYHCATAPVPMHIANGMYGLIYVEPEKGLPPVDKEFYIVQSDFYTQGKNGEKGLQAFDLEKGIKEQPEYIVFNGSVGALTGEGTLKAKVGDNIRIFFGVGGPNITSNFHVIGEIFDKVYTEGGTKYAQENVQTTVVPPGGSAIVEFKVDVPSTYVLVDHAIFRTFHKGTLGLLKVDGETNPMIYTGKQADEIYTPEAPAVSKPVEEKPVTVVEPVKKLDQMTEGKNVYTQNCLACHQENGQGVKGAFPPLAKSDFLMADKKRSIETVMYGLEKKITVNGIDYEGVMPKLDLSDDDIANVLTYVRAMWGNKGDKVTVAEVTTLRKK
ncbi:MAG: nitrite reductase, copper-containing [Bacteriovoracaceae bacterium]|nr:nitrite reductase, copper-containing [Bacteriovoracaceae bacterium]